MYLVHTSKIEDQSLDPHCGCWAWCWSVCLKGSERVLSVEWSIVRRTGHPSLKLLAIFSIVIWWCAIAAKYHRNFHQETLGGYMGIIFASATISTTPTTLNPST